MSAVVIPAYQPDEQLVSLVKQLAENQFSVVIVDDGSGEEYNGFFASCKDFAQIIHSPCNEGKGAALKRGFAAAQRLFPEEETFITADADGQHGVEDIIRVREKLESGSDFVLTVRYLQGKIPFRSRLGNVLSRIVYTVMNGHYFDDNQSGLRGFHKKHIQWLLRVKGDKYDYEMNMLCHADKQGIKIATLPIKAIYIDGNKSSHFNPVADTLRIYKRLFDSLWPSVFSVAMMEALVFAVSLFMNYQQARIAVPTAVMFSTLLSIALQRFVVFKKFVYRDYFRTLLFGAIRASAYTGFLNPIAIFTPNPPIFILFNIAVILVAAVEYQIHKIMHRIMWI